MSQSAVIIPFPIRPRRVRRSKAAALFSAFRELDEQERASTRLLIACTAFAVIASVSLQFLS
jgi:hypothetical protein